jgi:hypothetical protein
MEIGFSHQNVVLNKETGWWILSRNSITARNQETYLFSKAIHIGFGAHPIAS